MSLRRVSKENRRQARAQQLAVVPSLRVLVQRVVQELLQQLVCVLPSISSLSSPWCVNLPLLHP